MKLKLLQDQQYSAYAKYREYLAACKITKRGTQEHGTYNDLRKVYYAIKQGKDVIDMTTAIRAGGLKPNGQPCLAIAQANVKKVHCMFYTSGTIKYKSASNWKFVRSDWGAVKLFPEWKWANGDGSWRPMNLEAPVPIIPGKFTNIKITPNHYILWEVDEWRMVPSRDPYLLKRITLNNFIVVAQWDLTDVELSVMGARL